MMNLEVYFANLMLRELEQFRFSAPTPAEHYATEVAQPDHPSPSFATGQVSTSLQTTHTNSAIDNEENKQQALATQQPEDITALVDADEAAHGFQGTPVRLITLRDATDRQRKSNGARQQRIYRLAQKIGVTPGARWIRNGKPHMQPAVPRSVVRADGTVEYNQFMYDGVTGEVVLRMPGGWKRDLVRTRPQFLGVAVVDGFLWPRFHRSLPRRITVDWGELPPSFSSLLSLI